MDRKSLIENIKAKTREFRRQIVEITYRCGKAHIGSALSCIDIVACLYLGVLRVNPKNPRNSRRDRFILSKGHGCLALYILLAERGYLKKEALFSFCQFGTALGGHPDMQVIPGAEASSGSLGHGLSIGLGMAIAGKVDNSSYKVHVLLGDGECQEGSVWEAVMAAPHFKADNLVAIVDNNGLQVLDSVENTLSTLQPLAEKFRAFGWEVKEIDGHNIKQILDALSRVPFKKGRPSCVIAHTVKGKGVSFMENQLNWHYRGLNQEEYRQALEELRGSRLQKAKR